MIISGNKNNDTGYYFADAMQPIKFVTADSLDEEFDKVLIRVGTDLGGYNRPIGNITAEEEQKPEEFESKQIGIRGKTLKERREGFEQMIAEKKAEAEVKEGGEPMFPVVPQCAPNNPIYPFNYYKAVGINIFKPEIRFENISPDTILWIDAEPIPQMPTVNFKAILDSYCKRGQINFSWEYWIRYTLFRHKWDSIDTLCRRTGMVKITGSTNYEIGDPNGGGCPAESEWQVKFDYNPFEVAAEFVGKHPTQAGGCNAVIDHWYEGNRIFIGGDVWVKVIARDYLGQIIATGESNGGKILGRNPSIETMANYITDLEFEALVRKETAVRGGPPQHFNLEDNTLNYPNYGYTLPGWKYNKRGYPIYGVPNGYGFSQIDNSPPPTELDLWNWQSNLNSGLRKHRENKAAVVRDIMKIDALLDEKVILMNAYQRYNSGRDYWRWKEGADGKDGLWEKNPDRGKNPEYAQDAYDIYLDLLNH